ncbi:hypothetical protein RJ639_008022 [Escallonia herrerae]|uniref:Retrovirus-related Pol polyprotein from transposon TNT 1-94-like beta-barrel domain-containing protein n=1 Tax=Escallonia herrerae TaxID=1293975 RepID=A0AA89ARW8_9ASTE|nr:hypothetical protein RJ639_008022 [Escallonia herrerae]
MLPKSISLGLARLREEEEEPKRILQNHFLFDVHETIFSRIAAATTSKEACEILHKEFEGSSKVITVKLQSLRREFETLFMRNNESVQDFLSRVTAIVSQMKSYGQANKLASYAEEMEDEEESKLFMGSFNDTNVESGVWFVDSGCSNHMTGTRSMFKEFDESFKKLIWLGDDKKIEVGGKGTVAVKNSHRKVKLLHDVLFALSLAHNLLSVGKLM